MTEASRGGDVAQVVEQDARFHEMLYEHSGNPLLRRIYQTISAQFRIAAIQDDSRDARLQEIAGAHAQLLEAIERRDVHAAPPYLERAAKSRRASRSAGRTAW